MDKSHEQANETRKRNKQKRNAIKASEEAQARAQILALKVVRDHPDSTPTERLEAVKLLADYERRGYSLSMLIQS